MDCCDVQQGSGGEREGGGLRHTAEAHSPHQQVASLLVPVAAPPPRVASLNVNAFPLCVLQDNAVPILVFECLATDVPVGIERSNSDEARRQHACTSSLPLCLICNVENGQIFSSGARPHRMGPTVCELEVIAETRSAEHDSVEAPVVLETAKNAKAKPGAVHRLRASKIADRTSDSKVTLHGTRGRRRLIGLWKREVLVDGSSHTWSEARSRLCQERQFFRCRISSKRCVAVRVATESVNDCLMSKLEFVVAPRGVLSE